MDQDDQEAINITPTTSNFEVTTAPISYVETNSDNVDKVTHPVLPPQYGSDFDSESNGK